MTRDTRADIPAASPIWAALRMVAVWLAVSAAVWMARGGALLTRAELSAQDQFFLLRGPLPDTGAVVIVAIDDASFSQNGLQWPWPRDYLARIVDNIAAGNPRAIALDVFFYEPSNPASDSELARALRDAGNVVVTNDIVFDTLPGVTLQHMNLPIAEIDSAAAAVGLANFSPDADGTVRRIVATLDHDGQAAYGWTLHCVRLYVGAGDIARLADGSLQIGSQVVPLHGGQLTVNYAGPPESVPTISAWQVAEGAVDPAMFTGKIVMVGATTESLHDTYPTPFGSQPTMAGVEINANAANTILAGRYVTSPTEGSYALAIAIAGVVGVALAQRLSPLAGLLAAIALAGGYAALAAGAFTRFGMLFPLASPLLAGSLSFLAGTVISVYEEQRRRARVQGLFARYVAPAAIDQMLSQPDAVALSGQRKNLTILFSDIRGFTTLSENLTPDEVVRILNEYLSAMTEIIFRHEGTVDKFEGDAILAIFNAPLDVSDHPTKAVRCAVEMIQRLRELQHRWAAAGEEVLEIGIGVNTGEAFVGNIGSDLRMDYTVIGDTVNLASRLQDLTKETGAVILMGEETHARLDPSIAARYVTTAQVKGRAQPVNVYTVEMLPE